MENKCMVPCLTPELETKEKEGLIHNSLKINDKRQEKGKVCFGSGLERKTLESDTKGLVSKHARKYQRENIVSLGPGKYEISSQNSAIGPLLNKPTSKLGTVLGGRKAERKGAFNVNMLTPAPGTYDLPTTFPNNFKQMCAPFNIGLERRQHPTQDTPGVGVYHLNQYKRRTAAFAYSFGGKKCLLPTVKTKCGPFNFDTCERCQKFPEGDYWYLVSMEMDTKAKGKKNKQTQSEGTFLCRECYDFEKKENKMFSKGQMRNFKKIRDCSKIHFHDGCKAKLFLVPPQEIAKVKEREAYLQLYFN